MLNTPPLTGIITFLFTDIEGSTQLWERYPQVMKVALARHDALLREICHTHSGQIFKTMGDAFFMAFALPDQAVKTAIDAQRALQAESWGETIIRVRMTLHCGEVEPRDGDYFGQPLNRAARLLSAGHGGQVLISAALKNALRDQLPEQTSLRDMGERRLKDLLLPEHIYQLIIPGLPTDFAPLKTLDILRTNLPGQITSFIGRETEIAEVRKLLSSNRLVTLTGVGGTGKTRLSLQIASTLLDDYPEGVWFIELAPLAHPELVAQTIATTLQLHESSERTAEQTVREFLAARQVLLLLDNCEHLIQICADLTSGWLQHCPGLKILATSREPLGIAGEIIRRVPSFSIPQDLNAMSYAALAQVESVRFFVERAQSVQPNFSLTPANVSDVAKICTRLDGIPLALELAAARVRGMGVDQIATRLDSRFRLLTGGSRSSLPRQQTLSALIDWSYNLLSPSEQLLFQRLSIFSGLFSLDAVEAVCSGNGLDEYDVLDLLQRLIDKSLVLVDVRHNQTYYRLLETIRQYGRDKLLSADKVEDLANRHVLFFRTLAGQAAPALRGPEQVVWFQRLSVMAENFRTALEWSLETDQTEHALYLAGNLGWYWFVRTVNNEGRQWLQRAIQMPNSSAYPRFLVEALFQLVYHTWMQSGGEQALPIAEEAVKVARSSGDPWCLGLALSVRSFIFIDLKNLDAALPDQEIAESLLQKNGDQWNYAHALLNRTRLAELSGDPESTLSLHRQAHELFRQIGDHFSYGLALRLYGEQLTAQGDVAGGEKALKQSLGMANDLQSKAETSGNLFGLMYPAIARSDHIRAVTLGYAAKALQQSIGIWKPAGDPWLASVLNPCRAALGKELFETVCQKALEMSLDQVVVFALSDT